VYCSRKKEQLQEEGPPYAKTPKLTGNYETWKAEQEKNRYCDIHQKGKGKGG